jgi:hypothetical protein
MSHKQQRDQHGDLEGLYTGRAILVSGVLKRATGLPPARSRDTGVPYGLLTRPLYGVEGIAVSRGTLSARSP